ncbi:MAG: HAD family phosphatase [Candidatus Pseudobacter hemicellulosilyticus]|uniref:HAD family phosphatase n=1 Tax=Candidatus Pseudobacter hemicellulosilyticus TaxID=3121375 RepID=A0AAJ5WTR7_9BACT|nr:MAG: HAD family phosphatase [Pseudobacter sp.]
MAPQKKIDTIVFDLGGVLIDWNPEYMYKTIFTTDAEMRWFLDNITTGHWNEEQDGGRSLAEGTEWLVQQHPAHESNIRAFYDRWVEMLKGPIDGTVEILRHLKFDTDYKLYALTNWSAETYPIAQEKYEFLHWFEGVVVSGTEKVRKPFQPIYETLLSRFSIDPATAVYTDDNARNLAPAKELGMETIHFQSPEQFRQELARLGIL